MASFYGGVGVGSGGSGSGGLSISNIEIDKNRHFIIYLSDGTKKDFGIIDGATFTPVLVDGVISWTNNKGLENPPPYDLTAEIEDEGELWVPVDQSDPGEEPTPSNPDYVWESIG